MGRGGRHPLDGVEGRRKRKWKTALVLRYHVVHWEKALTVSEKTSGAKAPENGEFKKWEPKSLEDSPYHYRDQALADDVLTVGISSTALFDLREDAKLFAEQGLEAYQQRQIEMEKETLEPGVGFNFVRKLLDLNKQTKEKCTEVVLLSRNSADTGLRAFNSCDKHGLDIEKAVFCAGGDPCRYIEAFECDLFLSADAMDVRRALQGGSPAAQLLAGAQGDRVGDDRNLCIAFDGDAVLFSDEADRIYQDHGVAGFRQHEAEFAGELLEGGPFRPFLASMHKLQQRFPSGECPVRTVLVTARGAPAHERVVRTLRHWKVRLDEMVFAAGMRKNAFLDVVAADIFFDDQRRHCDDAAPTTAAGHVPFGGANALPPGEAAAP